MAVKRFYLFACTFFFFMAVFYASTLHTVEIDGVTVEYSVPDSQPATLSPDGKTMHYFSPVVLIADPNPSEVPVRIQPPRSALDEEGKIHANGAGATFLIDYIPAGQKDVYDTECIEYPEIAKNVLTAAGNIWSSVIDSSATITIRAGWANMEGNTLGYSGTIAWFRDFPNAPHAGTWYGSALANSLNGEDLDNSQYDMHITFNNNFDWYFALDGNTPFQQMDFLSVALHEIGHGLNFNGMVQYSSGQASYGYDSYPSIYEQFIRDGSNISILNTAYYPNPSTALGSLLTSNNVWFHGDNAILANGGTRVKIYAPSEWTPGSSYSHLDADTFAGTPNRLMVYALANGDAIHDPGPVTTGILQDMGWQAPSSDDKGSLRVTITPQAAIDAGARWKRTTGTQWLNSGETEYDLRVGNHTVEFKPTTGWTKPDNQIVSIVKDQLTEFCGNYTLEYVEPTQRIFFDDFEGDVSHWMQGEGPPYWVLWNGGYGGPPASAYSGNYNLLLADYFGPKTLFTPMLDLSGYPNAKLSFWYAQSQSYGNNDQLYVYSLSDPDGMFILLESFTENIENWTKQTIELPDLSSTYWICFVGYTNFGHGVCIDDVEIYTVLPPALSIEPSSRYHTAAGGIDTFAVNSNISWIATSNTGWITINSGHSGTNNGTVTYSVAENSSNAREGTITVTGGSMNAVFTVSQQAGAPTADFTASPLSGPAPHSVYFTDYSTGEITSWNWSFGDGHTCTHQNTSHTYTTPGIYTVSLAVSGTAGDHTEVKTGYITVLEPVSTFTETWHLY